MGTGFGDDLRRVHQEKPRLEVTTEYSSNRNAPSPDPRNAGQIATGARCSPRSPDTVASLFMAAPYPKAHQKWRRYDGSRAVVGGLNSD